MIPYEYENPAADPCIPYIKAAITASEISHKDYGGSTWIPANGGGDGMLTVFWHTALNVTDKGILDGIVTASLGLVPVRKERSKIMDDIFWTASADPTQLNRLLDALDNYTSVPVALDNYNYALARARVQKVFEDGKITEADRDMVLSFIPENEYVPA
jgi:hypothetical protein